MLAIPSPTGFTDTIVRYVAERLDELGIPFELTRRGTLRATLKGQKNSPDRAVSAHLDTIGASVRAIKDNGRDRKSTRLNSSHYQQSRMPSSA